MEFIQDLLTAAINFTALAGFGGIALHAIYKQHAKTAAIYAEVPHATPAPQIEPDTEVDTGVDTTLESPDIPSQQEAIADDIWETPVVTSAPRYWVSQPQSLKPALALMPAKEEIKPVTPTRRTTTKKTPEIDLNSLDAATLRKFCTQHQINWRNFLGKGKHMKKATMIEQLQQKLVA